MKNFILALILITSSTAFATPPLMCARFTGTGTKVRDGHPSIDPDDWEIHYSKINSKDVLYKGSFSTKCIQPGRKYDNDYIVHLKGYGLGLSIGTGNAVTISCPLVKRKRLTEDYFYGVDVHAEAGVGGHVGVFFNKRLGTCFLIGLDLGGIGAAIKGARLSIEENNGW